MVENQFVIFCRVNQYIETGLKDVIVDPDPELIYTKRKIAKKQAATFLRDDYVKEIESYKAWEFSGQILLESDRFCNQETFSGFAACPWF